MLLAAPEPRSQAHLSNMSCSRRHTFGIITANPAPGAALGPFGSRTQRQNCLISSQTLFPNSPWLQTELEEEEECDLLPGQNKSWCSADALCRTCLFPVTQAGASTQSHAPNLSCAQENLGSQSPGGDVPTPPPHCKQREELAWAVLLGNGAQLPTAPSPGCAALPIPSPHQGMGFVPLKARNQHLHFPRLERGEEVSIPPLQLSSLVLNKPAGREGTWFPTLAPLVIYLPQCHIPALNTHQCARGWQPRSILPCRITADANFHLHKQMHDGCKYCQTILCSDQH